jgi:hypothetical protein
MPVTVRFLSALAVGLLSATGHAQTGAPEPKLRPIFADFVGLCGHTVNFKPELYSPVCRWVRDYHPVKWDLADDTSVLPEWPFAKNKVSWEQVYGSWHKEGLRISVCFQIDEMQKDWKDMAKDARAYATSFAENFGPGGKWPYVECVELGNEPGLYDDPSYRAIFEAMARGVREGNPKLKIATCNIETGKSERYWKGTDCLTGFEELYDVIRIHRYAIAEQWPVWRRTYPEDPKVPFLSHIQDLLDWRDKNAPGKPVWVSEFGWDASSKEPDPKGEWAKWKDSTDEEQAQWMVRSYLLFAEMGVDKAFAYFFNDKDEAKLHHASGITRNYEPKPAYHAIAWMLQSLVGNRFKKVIRKSLDEGYVYEFSPEKTGHYPVWAAWHPTKDGQQMKLKTGNRKFLRAERMPFTKGDAEPVKYAVEDNTITFTAGVRPIFLWFDE